MRLRPRWKGALSLGLALCVSAAALAQPSQALPEKTMQKMLTMRAAWRTGNAKQLTDTLLKDLGECPEIYEALFTRRNKNWLPQIEALFKKEGRYLVIVGAGHLIGKDGLLDLLKKKGYSLQQL